MDFWFRQSRNKTRRKNRRINHRQNFESSPDRNSSATISWNSEWTTWATWWSSSRRSTNSATRTKHAFAFWQTRYSTTATFQLCYLSSWGQPKAPQALAFRHRCTSCLWLWKTSSRSTYTMRLLWFWCMTKSLWDFSACWQWKEFLWTQRCRTGSSGCTDYPCTTRRPSSCKSTSACTADRPS